MIKKQIQEILDYTNEKSKETKDEKESPYVTLVLAKEFYDDVIKQGDYIASDYQSKDIYNAKVIQAEKMLIQAKTLVDEYEKAEIDRIQTQTQTEMER